MASKINLLDTAPSLDDFTPLSEHEEATPATFFGGKPVLHSRLVDCHVVISRAAVAKNEELGAALGITTSPSAGVNGHSEGHADAASPDPAHMFVAEHVGVFVTSQSVLMQQANAASIPYPAISLHATQRLARISNLPLHYSTEIESATGSEQVQAIYLQIDPQFATRDQTNPDVDDDEDNTIELMLIPAGDQTENASMVKEVFEALSRCADLNPDPAIEGDDEQGGLGALLGGIPGSGGWITSDNAHEFEGEFAEGTPMVETGLGPGAGSRRTRDEDKAEEDVEDEGEDTKWQRTG